MTDKAYMETLEDIKRLLERCRGKKNALSAKLIGTFLGVTEDDTHYLSRMYILEAIKVLHIPIAACNKGYYWIETDEELQDYLKRLDSRINEISERRSVVEKAFYDGKEKDNE